MCDVIKECSACKGTIEIDIYNIHDVARVKSKYFHPTCLSKHAQKLVQRTKHDACWDYALNNLEACEKDAKEIIYKRYWQDTLNEHLLERYDVTAMPDRFWEMIMNLHNGIYKDKKCKPVSMDTVCNAWIWAQKNLDAINRRNKQNKKGPKTDAERLNYDFTIVLKHIPDYLKAKAKRDAEEAERQARDKEKSKINYNNIATNTKTQSEGLDDISGLLDEF